MTGKSPSLSIIIPTYNRAGPLRHTLATCVAQCYEFVEFIVQDDASTDNTAQIVAEIAATDPRVRYMNSGSNAGMRLNFEQALQSATGEYAIILGGDDALIPDALKELAKLIVQNPDDIISWPTSGFLYADAREGKSQLITPHALFQKPALTRLSAHSYLERQALDPFYITDIRSPMLYVKSCAPMKLVREGAKRSGGAFFISSTPDGYSSFALASLMDSYVYTNTSYTMHGVSGNSAGLNYVAGKGGKEDYSEKFFKENKQVPMVPQLASAPYSPLITLMTADFLYQTDNLFNHGYSKGISIDALIIKSMMELSDGLFSQAKIKRELDILHQIAKFHGKVDFFMGALRKSRRNSRKTLTGDAISPFLLYLDGGSRGLENVYDAAKFVKAHQNSRRVYALLNPLETIRNAVGYKMQSYQLRESLADYF
jgi:glycosyltransferase involved in cell wall biosynthesis